MVASVQLNAAVQLNDTRVQLNGGPYTEGAAAGGSSSHSVAFPSTATFPDVVVEISTSDPLASSVTWTTVTSSKRIGFRIDRGRQDQLSAVPPGVCTLTVDNADRDWDPDHGGTYSSLITPGRRMRIRTTAPVSASLFDGFVDSWDTIWDWHGDSTVEIHLVDIMGVVAAGSVASIADGTGDGDTT
ncbi:MAG TPA: hypothetical protein ENI86_09325, partial [Acidimicrobiales bacterium]|nr:hypothetical protein [Acidimicrobiales bacterium]